MTFTVTYRAKDGALREERVDAANRAECVAECRKRGISPTGIREGGKGKGRDGARPSRVGEGDNKRTTARWVAAAVVVAAIAGGGRLNPRQEVRGISRPTDSILYCRHCIAN